MDDIDVVQHQHLLEEIVSNHISAKLEIVENIPEWCEQNGGGQLASDKDSLLGKALWGSATEPNRVLLKRHILAKQIEDHMFGLFLRDFKNVYYLIPDSLTFLKHLALHEIAHIKHDWRQDHERDCDRWAFEQLELVGRVSKA